MSEKKNNETVEEKVTTEETVETINEAPVEEAPSTESEGTAKEEAVETPVEPEKEEKVEETKEVKTTPDEPVVETPIEEVTEETTKEPEVEEEIDFSDLPNNIGDEVDTEPEADVTNPEHAEDVDGEVDPLPEEEGIYYCEVTVGYNTRSVVEERLEKYNIPFIVTATGAILVGSYNTEEEAVEGRKLLLTRGLKGTVVTFS